MSNAQTDETTLDQISKKLNVLIALSLRQLIGDQELGQRQKKNVGDTARYLARMKLDAKDIADILGSPLSSVRTLLTPSQRK